MRVLVTGGAGFIGSWVIDALLARPDVEAVMSFDCLEKQVHPDSPTWPSYQFQSNPDAWVTPPNGGQARARCWFGDVRDPRATIQAFTDFRPDVVIHLAAMVGVGQSAQQPARYVSANVTGTAVVLDSVAKINELYAGRVAMLAEIENRPEIDVSEGDGTTAEEAEAARAAFDAAIRLEAEGLPDRPIRTVIVAGSMSSYGEGGVDEWGAPACVVEERPLAPASVYAWTKKAQEEVARMIGDASGLDVRVARFFNVYGPRQALTNPYTGLGAIFGARCLAGLAPRVYEDGKQARDFIHVKDVARALLAIIDRGASGATYNVGTGIATTIGWFAKAVRDEMAAVTGAPIPEPEVTGLYRVGDVRYCIASTWQIRSLGWLPEVGVSNGIADLCEWVRHSPMSVRDRVVRDADLAHQQLLDAGLLVPVESEGT